MQLTARPPTRPIEILVVEDNPGDVHLMMESLKAARIRNRIEIVRDGEAAIEYIRREGKYGERTRPDLILLDLNLPRMDGHEVLAAVRDHPDTSSIPVVVLTSSERSADVERSYGLRANCYITKPVGVDAFIDVVRSISSFWFEIVTLPTDAPL